MVIVWTIVALVLSLIATNLVWALLAVALPVLRFQTDPIEFASGQLLSYKVVNFVFGNAAGFWSISVANWFLQYVEVGSLVPVWIIGAVLAILLLGTARLATATRHVMPYSKYGVFGEAVGLTIGLIGVLVGK